MPYRPGPPCPPPPPIIRPIDATEDIRLKLLESKVVPKDTTNLSEIDKCQDLVATDYVYVSDGNGNLRKLAARKIASSSSEQGLTFTGAVVIEHSGLEPFDPAGTIVQGISISLFNRRPEQGETFTLYINVVDPITGNGPLWLGTAQIVSVNPLLTTADIKILPGGLNITDSITDSIEEVLETKITAITVEPTSDNPADRPVLVCLDHEPAQKYKGYFYLIETDVDPSDIEGTTILLGSDSYIVDQVIHFESGEEIDNNRIIL